MGGPQPRIRPGQRLACGEAGNLSVPRGGAPRLPRRRLGSDVIL